MQRYELTFYPEGEMIPHRQGEYIRYADHEQAVAKAREALAELLDAESDATDYEGIAGLPFAERLKEQHRASLRYNNALIAAREALAALSPTDSGK